MLTLSILLAFSSPQLAPPAKPTELTLTRSQVLDLTNKERKANRLSVLKSNPTLEKAAQALADDMAKRKFFSHTDPDGKGMVERLKSVGVTNVTLAENICMGTRTAEETLKLWMGSKGHRQNILGDEVRLLGVGFAKNATGTPYWVQVFASSVPE